METNTDAMTEVDNIALQLLDAGRFKSQAEARNYVFETRPQLAEKVRAESNAAHIAKSARKAPATLSPARAEVEKRALQLVDAGEQPSIVEARAHVYETQPKLAAAVRAESA